MRKYLVMPENCRWMEVEATSAEIAYRSVCYWYGSDRKIAVMDFETKETVVFTRKIERAGNFVAVFCA